MGGGNEHEDARLKRMFELSSTACPRCGTVLPKAGLPCPRCLLTLGLLVREEPEDLPPPSGPFAPVRRLGRYALLEEVGRGGMGVVFRALQTDLHREVAVKLLAAGPFAARVSVDRFRREAEALARLSRPGIVTVHEVGAIERQPFLAMELNTGGSLADRVLGRSMAPLQAAGCLLEVSAAVAHAHASGVWQRDLKPGNILLDGHDGPRITDFGLAKFAEGEAGLTCSGETLGTPGDLAPEQLDEALHPVGPWTDVSWRRGREGRCPGV